MFGHDNQDNQDDTTPQITLPPAQDLVADDGTSLSLPVTEPQPAEEHHEEPRDEVPVTDHRQVVKTGAPTDDLLDIKQQALQALTPLIDHLEQSPEEKFRTTMMMIQASDNHSLIQLAYEAAQQIKDDKERAQALLDIVNEINYFTQQQQAA